MLRARNYGYENGADSPTVSLGMLTVVVEVHKECFLPDVRRQAFDLEGLEAHPAKKLRVRRSEFAEVLGNIVVVHGVC